MDSSTRDHLPSPDGVEFVRYCYRRRRVGWPELYDEMCAVAHRGLYRGWGADELSAEGIGFTLYQMPALASVVGRVVAEEHERRSHAALLAARAAEARTPNAGRDDGASKADAGSTEAPADPNHKLRFAGATAGA